MDRGVSTSNIGVGLRCAAGNKPQYLNGIMRTLHVCRCVSDTHTSTASQRSHYNTSQHGDGRACHRNMNVIIIKVNDMECGPINFVLPCRADAYMWYGVLSMRHTHAHIRRPRDACAEHTMVASVRLPIALRMRVLGREMISRRGFRARTPFACARAF